MMRSGYPLGVRQRDAVLYFGRTLRFVGGRCCPRRVEALALLSGCMIPFVLDLVAKVVKTE
jgi:hypothetical protein